MATSKAREIEVLNIHMTTSLGACHTATTQAASWRGPAQAWVVAKSPFLLVLLIYQLFLVATTIQNINYPLTLVIMRSWWIKIGFNLASRTSPCLLTQVCQCGSIGH
jgi:hypothetical protein